VNVSGVDVVNWNPKRRILPDPWGKVLRVKRSVNNFGDLLGPMIVRELVRRMAGRAARHGMGQPASARLLSVGSILHLARSNDVVWGSGANGKSLHRVPPKDLDIRAVRGPLTRAFLLEHGIDAPEVFGDPGLLVGHLWGRKELRRDRPARSVTIVPNLNDLPAYRADARILDPRRPLAFCLSTIAASDLVVGSSLHAVIVAESLGIPARLIHSSHEPELKYRDYYLGSGREEIASASSVSEAIEMGGAAPLTWDHTPLLRAFPQDLWSMVPS